MSEQKTPPGSKPAGGTGPGSEDRTQVLPRLDGPGVPPVAAGRATPRAAGDPARPVGERGSVPLAARTTVGTSPPGSPGPTGISAAPPGPAGGLAGARGSGPAAARTGRGGTTPASARGRRARLRLRRVDPWSVFLLSLVTSLFLAIALVVAVVALYAVLAAAGVPESVNALFAEVTRQPGGGEPPPLLTAGRAITVAGLLAVLDVVLLTALSTLGALLYNVCASFTGGVEVTLAERDER